MKTKILFATALFSIQSFCFAALPVGWYQEGQSFGNRIEKQTVSPTEPDAATDEVLAREIDNNLKVLDKLADKEQTKNFAESSTKWHLSNFAFDLGLTASGVVGLMLVQGQSLVNMYWRRVKAPQSIQQLEQSQDNSAALDLSDPLSEDEIRTRVEPIVSAMMATGKVKNENVLRESVFRAALDFHDMVQGLNTLTDTSGWTPSRLRLDFIVSASGMVYPGIEVGGELRFRFDWFPKPGHTSPTLMGPPSERSANVRNLVSNVASQMSQVKVDTSRLPPDVRLTQMVFSLGMFANGNFGIARANASIVGSIFMAAPRGPVKAMATNGSKPVPVVSNGLESIPAKTFQEGMDKAVHMGSYFARQAAKHHGKRWEFDQLRVQYGISLGGTVVLATVGGSAAVQAIFQNFGH